MTSYIPVYNISNNDDFKKFLIREENIDSIAEDYEMVNPETQETNDTFKPIQKLNKIDYTTQNNQQYKIIRYDKPYLAIDLIPTYGLFRSVILNKEGEVVCFAPPKSIPYDSFIKIYPEKNNHIIAEEFVEGTMINVFWDRSSGLSGSWEIATRSTVGADISFYKDKYSANFKTFRAMFLEACSVNNLDINLLDPKYCYSFVLQHPDNRIVVPFIKPQLFLVALYEITHTANDTVNVFPLNSRDHLYSSIFSSTTVKYPQIYEEWTDYADVTNQFASINTSYAIVGVVIYNNITGDRCKLRNPVYEMVRQLRGNQSKLQYQYLSLRQQGKVRDFLQYYPENKKECSFFRDMLHNFTNTLFQNYISCYIRKEKPLKEFSQQFRTHMFNIHQNYMTNLKPANDYVTNTVVMEYVNKLHPSLQMYSLNYAMRKRRVDFIKADKEEM